MKQSIGRRIGTLAAAGIAGALVVALAAFFVIAATGGAIDRMHHAVDARDALTLGDMYHDATRADVISMIAAQNADELNAAVKEAETDSQLFIDNIAKALAATDDPTGKAKVSALLPDARTYRDLALSVAAAARQGGPAAARVALAPFVAQFDKLDGSQAATAEVLSAEATAASQGASGDIVWAIVTIVVVLVAVVVVLVIVSRRLTRHIVAPIEDMRTSAERIAVGDIDGLEVTYTNADELGQLADSFRATIAYLDEIAAASREVAEGHLNVTVRPRGERDVLGNATAGMIRYLAETSAALDAIGRGDIDTPFAARDEADVLGQTAERLQGTLSHLTFEITKVSGDAAAGELSSRADVSGLSGSFAEMVNGVNATVDAIVGPLRAVANALDALAAHDLTTRVSGSYPGEFARLVSAFDEAARSLDDALAQVHEVADQVAIASEEIAESSSQLAQASTNQTVALHDIAGSVHEVAAMAESNTDSAQHSYELVAKVNDNVSSGVTLAAQLTDAVGRIKEATEATSRIISSINDIAGQTNLLSLNAAIEASSAGEAGKGFAVVADEVRNLARSSAQAARQIEDLIRASIDIVEEGVAINDAVRGQFDEIRDLMGDASRSTGQIATASSEQGTGMAQARDAIERVQSTVEDNAASAERSAAAAEELTAQSQMLRRLSAEFRTSYGNRRRPGAQPRLQAVRGGLDDSARSASGPLAAVEVGFNLDDQALFDEF